MSKRTRNMFNLTGANMATPNRPLYTPKKPKKVNRPPNKTSLSNVAGVVSNVMLKKPNHSSTMVRYANKPVSNDNRTFASINRELAERVYMKNFVNSDTFKANYKKTLQNLNGTNYTKGKAAYNKIFKSMIRASHRAMGMA